MHNTYDRSLQIVMRHQRTTFIVSLVVLVATGVLFKVIPKGFFPDQDTGQISGTTEAAQDVSFEAMRDHQLQVAKIVDNDPNVDVFMSAINGPNSGRILIRLKPRSERKLNATEVIQELRPKLAAVPGMNVYLQNPPLIRIGGMQRQSPLPIQPSGHGHKGALLLGANSDEQNRRVARFAGRDK